MQQQEDGSVIGESGIVFPALSAPDRPRGFAIEPMIRETLTIMKKHEDASTAQVLAHTEYNLFFAQWWKFIQRSTHHILNEIYGAESKIGYLIRIELQAPESKMLEIKRWVAIHLQSEEVG